MTSNKKPRKPGRNARANQRLNPIERALIRANWRKAEAELLEMREGDIERATMHRARVIAGIEEAACPA